MKLKKEKLDDITWANHPVDNLRLMPDGHLVLKDGSSVQQYFKETYKRLAKTELVLETGGVQINVFARRAAIEGSIPHIA